MSAWWPREATQNTTLPPDQTYTINTQGQYMVTLTADTKKHGSCSGRRPTGVMTVMSGK
jgi:hypothetical protein